MKFSRAPRANFDDAPSRKMSVYVPAVLLCLFKDLSVSNVSVYLVPNFDSYFIEKNTKTKKSHITFMDNSYLIAIAT